MSDKPDLSTAYHEAGHLVAGYLLGRGGVRRVSIVARDGSLEAVSYRARGQKWFDALEEADSDASYGEFIKTSTRRSIEIEIMVSLAGGLTEMTALGLDEDNVNLGIGLIPYRAEQRAELASRVDDVPQDLVHLAGDYEYVSLLAEKVSGGLDEANAYIAWLEQRTKNLVRHPWFMPAAHALASALLERKTLSSREVRATIDAAIEAAFPPPEAGLLA